MSCQKYDYRIFFQAYHVFISHHDVAAYVKNAIVKITQLFHNFGFNFPELVPAVFLDIFWYAACFFEYLFLCEYKLPVEFSGQKPAYCCLARSPETHNCNIHLFEALFMPIIYAFCQLKANTSQYAL